ncbi:hypothetical protein BLNAU_14760 [Blattamonas nauphoetae]|uniref:Uncharacterized protein n=1 Tax=Blattamonas nauphoetae TaxID=2049346 RepID=A0ABQ9XG24_9EUKA|nr:hypothetical protein BLNAU_14760 [Blattamonas nauphoetae]
MKLLEILYSKSPSFVRSSISSEIPTFILTHFGNCLKCPALESCCSCMESLFIEPEIVDSLFLRHKDLILSTFRSIGNSAPSAAVLTTLARFSLFPHLVIAAWSLDALFHIVERDPPAITLLPSRIFPFSYLHQQYSGLSFLAALTKKLRIVWTDFQTNLPTDPSDLPKYLELTKDDRYNVTHPLGFCSHSFRIPNLLLNATPPIEVNSQIIRKLILFVKETLTTILTTISNIDNLIASLPSDSSPTTPLVPGVDAQMTFTLQILRKEFADYVDSSWCFFADLTCNLTTLHRPSFEKIVLDDPSFPDLVLNSLKLPRQDVRSNTLRTVTNVVCEFPWMKKKMAASHFVEKMFETVDFGSFPLSASHTIFQLSNFIANMISPIQGDEKTWFKQPDLVSLSVFEPAKPFLTYLFQNSDKLILDEADKAELDFRVCLVHRHIKNMELGSFNLCPDFVTSEWKQHEPEQQKRREVLLREEGWDDAFELRVEPVKFQYEQTLIEIGRLMNPRSSLFHLRQAHLV